MRIAVIYNPPKHSPAKSNWLARSNSVQVPDDSGLHEAAEFGVLGEVALVQASLIAVGHEVTIFAADDAGELCNFLSRRRPELIFNCCEAFAGHAALEMNVVALFELFGIPHTGSSALTLGLALQKPLAKALLGAHGVATPAHILVEPGRNPAAALELSFPLIVKPAAEDASIGIDDRSVVNDAVALDERVRFVWREFRQAALVEAFISGREFNVSLLATSDTEFATLPISEIVFDGLAPGRPPILGYEAKWNTRATYNQVEAARCPADLDSLTAERIRQVALKAARTLGLRDYGRVDLRLRDNDQEVFVLELNPNPDLSEECEFLRAARASGLSNTDTVCEIVARAVERSGLADPDASVRNSAREPPDRRAISQE